MTILTRNPILWQEMTHLERVSPRWMRWMRLPAFLIFIGTIVYIISTLDRPDGSAREVALFAIWIVHAATSIRAIVAGANAISREHVGQTWDALVLTGVSARWILLGKWWAAIYSMRAWILAFGIIRLVMLPVFLYALVIRFAWYRGYYYSSYGQDVLRWVPEAALFSVVMTLVLTLLEVLCSTGLGLAASALTRRGSVATALAIFIRFLPVICFAVFTRYETGPASFRWSRFPPFAIADGGTSPLYQLVLPLVPWAQDRHLTALPGLFLVAGLLATLTLLSFAATLLVIRRTGALPHLVKRGEPSHDQSRDQMVLVRSN